MNKPALLNLGCGTSYHPAWTNVDIVPADRSVLRHDLQQPLPFGTATFDAVYHSHVLEHLPRVKALSFLNECRRVVRPNGVIRVAVPDFEKLARNYLKMLEGALRGEPVARERYEWSVIELIDQIARNHPDGGEMFKYLLRSPVPALDFVLERLGYEISSKLEVIDKMKREGWTPARIDKAREGRSEKEIGRFRVSGEVHQWMYDRYSLGMILQEAGFENPKVTTAHESAIPDFPTYNLDVLPDGAIRKPDSMFMEAVAS